MSRDSLAAPSRKMQKKSPTLAVADAGFPREGA
jgi:hypothetical protein